MDVCFYLADLGLICLFDLNPYLVVLTSCSTKRLCFCVIYLFYFLYQFTYFVVRITAYETCDKVFDEMLEALLCFIY